jgi:hypothetical protein
MAHCMVSGNDTLNDACYRSGANTTGGRKSVRSRGRALLFMNFLSN